jgi:hypothetical protein
MDAFDCTASYGVYDGDTERFEQDAEADPSHRWRERLRSDIRPFNARFYIKSEQQQVQSSSSARSHSRLVSPMRRFLRISLPVVEFDSAYTSSTIVQ